VCTVLQLFCGTVNDVLLHAKHCKLLEKLNLYPIDPDDNAGPINTDKVVEIINACPRLRVIIVRPSDRAAVFAALVHLAVSITITTCHTDSDVNIIDYSMG